jgi:hypothetical protein
VQPMSKGAEVERGRRACSTPCTAVSLTYFDKRAHIRYIQRSYADGNTKSAWRLPKCSSGEGAHSSSESSAMPHIFGFFRENWLEVVLI